MGDFNAKEGPEKSLMLLEIESVENSVPGKHQKMEQIIQTYKTKLITLW